LASLNHPNVGAIYGLELHDGDTPFLVLELIPGETLAQRLDRGPLEIRRVAHNSFDDSGVRLSLTVTPYRRQDGSRKNQIER
jgi:hypothetical protein